MPTKSKRSRAARARDEGTVIHYPPVGFGGYLVGYLFEVGPVGWAGMGEVPVSHQELAAWQGNTGVTLQGWEVQAIRQLSRDYVTALAEARDPMCPAPWPPQDIDNAARANVSKRLKSLFGTLAAQPVSAKGMKNARRYR